ncbi:hypothetical protein OC835_003754 [Tilletia horrida]|nr:hypothetical protein OC835_003754 [Tilletia horrida]
MPLHLTHTKSYNPYSEKNKERVRRDEEEERRRLEAEQQQRQDADSEARIEALRRRNGGRSSGQQQQQHGSHTATRETEQGHINFFADLESGTGRALGPQPGPSRLDRRYNSDPASAAADREKLAHALGGPTAADDRQPWYSSPDLQSAVQRRRSDQQRLAAASRDNAVKSREDPLKLINHIAAQRKEKDLKRKRAQEKAKAMESPYGDASSSSAWKEAGDYSDQYNRDDVRAARKRRRGSSPSSPSKLRKSSEASEGDRREGKRRAYDDDDVGGADTRRSSSSSKHGDHGRGASGSAFPLPGAAPRAMDGAVLGNRLFHSSDQDLLSKSDIGVPESPCRARAPPTPPDPALSFPPCGQVPAARMPNAYSHDTSLHPPAQSARNNTITTLFPTFSPSSSFEDVKKEPNSDDIPIALLAEIEAEEQRRLDAKKAEAGKARVEDDASDSEMDSVSPSPLDRKAPPSADTHSTDQLRTTSPAHVPSDAIAPDPPIDPLDKALADLASDSPSVKVEPSSGQAPLRQPEPENDGDDVPATTVEVKDEILTQQLPPKPTAPHTIASAELPAAATSVADAPGSGQARTSAEVPANPPPPRAPLTLIDAQRIGFFPQRWGHAGKLSNLTQGSEFDELGPESTQATATAITPVPSQSNDLDPGKSALDAEALAVSSAAAIPEEKMPPTTPERVHSPAEDAPAAVEEQVAEEAGEAEEDGSPDRTQQQFWGAGIWRSQRQRKGPVPNAFDLMQKAAKVPVAAADPSKKEAQLDADEAKVSMEGVEEEMANADALLDGTLEADVKIRESMYPTALSEMIETVLEHEDFLFSANEVAFLQHYATLTYEARYLFSRLIQRKHQWYRVDSLRYERDVKNMAAAVKELSQTLPDLVAQHSQHVRNQSTADEPLLTRFAYTQHDHGFFDSVGEMLDLLKVEELKSLAKRMGVLKASLSSRADLIEALLAVKTQSTLSRFNGSPSRQSKAIGPSASPSKSESPFRQLTLNFDGSGNKTAQSNHLKKTVQDLIGEAIFIPSEVRSLIDRVALVYYRGNVFNSIGNALTLAVLALCRKRNFPEVQVKRSKDLFKSRDQLKRYEKACAQEYKMVLLVDGSFEAKRVAGATPETFIGQYAFNAHEEALPEMRSAESYKAGVTLFEQIFQEWKEAVSECEQESAENKDRIMYHRMRFHPGWPLTRIVHKATSCLARLKDYVREEEVLNALLAQNTFCRGRRGEWYDRLALITNRYLSGGKRGERAVAMKGLQDPDTHMIFHRSLRSRIKRVENQIKFPYREQHHDFHIYEQEMCPEVTFLGIRLDRMLPASDSSSSLAIVEDGPVSAKKQWDQVFAKPSSPAKTGRSNSFKGKEPVRGVAAKALSPRRNSPDKEKGEVEASGFVKRAVLQKEITIERVVKSPGKGKGVQNDSKDPFDVAADVYDGREGAIESVKIEFAGKEVKSDMHSVWRGLDGVGCGVEELCLQHFAKDGWKGMHCEGGIIRMLFTLAMWDVIFLPVEGAFETKYQSEPLDMRTDAFAIVRKSEVKQRVEEIGATGGLAFIKETDDRERPRKTFACGCNWDRYSLAELLEVAECMGGGPLSTVCEMFCEEWEHCQAGMPDLCIWKPESKKMRLVEVKGPGDELREKQRVWIDALVAAKVPVQVALVRDVAVTEGKGKGKAGGKKAVVKREGRMASPGKK